MDKSCFVIGAGPGIGAAVAEAFAHEGYDIALFCRHPDKLERICADIRKHQRRRVQAFAADAAKDASLKTALGKARAEFGDPEVLVYNAAVAQTGKPTTVPTERLVAEFRTNVAGALVCAREVSPAMVQRGHGTILFTGGSFAYEPATDYASLSLGKAALRSLTYTLAQELGTPGVHVATVTVYGFVQPGTKFDPHRIAQAYIQLHRQKPGHFDIETVYK